MFDELQYTTPSVADEIGETTIINEPSKNGHPRGAHFINGGLKRIENYNSRARVIASILSPSGRINFYRQPKVCHSRLSHHFCIDKPINSDLELM